MSSRIVSRRDLVFQLFEVLDVESLRERPRFAQHSRETLLGAIDTALAIAGEKFAPHNRKADEHEPTFQGGRVHLIPEVKEAIDAYIAAGFLSAGEDFDKGGMQLPTAVRAACQSIFAAANVSTTAYLSLTTGNAALLTAFASPEQKERYLRHLLSGRFFGTMALTEPQAGSSLSDILTTATPNPDGSYSLRGTKIFISAGDHDLAENIVHLVLAKIPGAPPGVKGISLFVVPKYRVNADGSLGPANDVTLAGLFHKMGYRGTVSTQLSFGEKGECRAELVGQPNQGLTYMFHMMNGARISVGMGAVMIGYTSYLHALDYARERPQGRPLSAKDPRSPQVSIVEHADVRRMLLAAKSYVEGGLALGLYAARLDDELDTAVSSEARRDAEALLSLLTPVVKAWPSQYCLLASDLAIQVHGGYGYTREYPVEQFYRDNRLNPIHEGTNGIQALDLLGRKALGGGGTALGLLMRAMWPDIEAAGQVEALRHFGDELGQAAERLVATTRRLGDAARNDVERALANATVYLEAMGHAIVAWMWLRQALAATRALSGASAADADFYRGKLAACRYFFRWELPRIGPQLALLDSLDSTVLETQPAWL
ncbi:MAG TPA: acyl-CoA dehydrogenase [Myxococcales bacterium]|nr:acyl-CoA dehydrogenase [Myxococcales bacterium]